MKNPIYLPDGGKRGHSALRFDVETDGETVICKISGPSLVDLFGAPRQRPNDLKAAFARNADAIVSAARRRLARMRDRPIRALTLVTSDFLTPG